MKNFTITLLLTLGYLVTQAQPTWLTGMGGNSQDEVQDVAHDTLGNIYTTGYFSTNCQWGNIQKYAAGMSDIFIARQNSSGVYQWVASAGGSQADKAYGVTTDNAGNIFITGVYRDTATFGSTTLVSVSNSQDIFVAKLNSSGNFVWAISMGGADTDLSSGIAIDNNGEIVLTGRFKGTANFGTNTFNSALYPSGLPGIGGTPSYDIFITKISSSGNILWAKHGAAPYDDQGFQLSTDGSDNIYLCGQFSDTLQFTNTYFNNGFNAGFVLKLDAAGNEKWLKRVFAPQVMVQDIVCSGNKCWITGDCSGTLFFTQPSASFPSSAYSKNIYTACMDTTGVIAWCSFEGSENNVSANSICVDANKEVYTSGVFGCNFTSMSDTLGAGLFNSIGFQDVFVFKYDIAGKRNWEKHYGGTGNDFLWGISVYENAQPVLAGGYYKTFNITHDVNLNVHADNDDFSNISANNNITHCGDGTYADIITRLSSGLLDGFVTRPVDVNAAPYDFFARTTNTCDLSVLNPLFPMAGDTLIACEHTTLGIYTRTTRDSLTGPEWVYSWSNGSTQKISYVSSTGWYSADYGYADQCRSFHDSVYVIIDQPAPEPIIQTTYGIIDKAIPHDGCYNKLFIMNTDTASLYVTNVPAGYSFEWQTPYGTFNNQQMVEILQEGIYTVSVISPNGVCVKTGCVGVKYFQSGNCTASGSGNDEFLILLSEPSFEATDTVHVCVDEYFGVDLVDSVLYSININPTILYTFVDWTINYGPFQFSFPLSFETTAGLHHQEFLATGTGNCSVTATILHPITHVPIYTRTRTFYIQSYQAPANNPVINGPSYFCPGDTVTLVASGGDNYNWSGPGIIAMNFPENDTVVVVMAGVYGLSSVTYDPIMGCADVKTATFDLGSLPPPVISMVPSSGLVCPNDSVQLNAMNGNSFIWYGPTGSAIDTGQSIWTTTPGLYYYEYVSSSGCSVISQVAEVSEYTTPFIDAFPGTSLCGNDSVMIQAITNANSVIWSSPLTGTQLTQIIHTPGTYTATIQSCNITTSVSVNVTAGGSNVNIINSGNDTLCGLQNTLLTASAGMVSYTWFPDNVSGPVYNAEEGGTYILEATDTNGCTGTDTIVIYEIQNINGPSAWDTLICENSDVDLVAQGNYPVIWYQDANGTQQFSTGNTVSLQSVAANTILYAAFDYGVCISNTSPYEVEVLSVPPAPEITGDTLICIGGNMMLEIINPQYNYIWTGPGGLTSTGPTLNIPGFSNADEGMYYAEAVVFPCGSSMDSIYVNSYQLEVAPFANQQINICAGDTAILFTDTLDGSYQWSNGVDNEILPVTSPGAYSYVYTSAEGCVAYSDTVNVNQFPPVNIGLGDTILACDTVVALDAGNPGADYLWNTSATTQQIIAASSGNYEVMVTDTNGCSAQDSVFVWIGSAPVASFDAVTSDGVTSFNNLSNNADTWTWYFGDNTTSTSLHPTHNYSANGTYTITLVVSNECGTDTYVQTITINDLGTSEVDPSAVVSMYPNPATEMVNIKMEEAEATLQIYDAAGKLITTQILKSQHTQVSMLELSEGMYIFELLLHNKVHRERIVKLK